MKYFLIILILISCSKQSIQENHYQYDSYELIIDRYSPDTSELLLRTIWWKDDSIWKPEMKLMLDTMPDQWWLICATIAIPLHLDHDYLMKNGKKIQPSTYPKQTKP